MANEITLNVSLDLTRAVPVENAHWDEKSVSANQTGNATSRSVLSVGTTAGVIPVTAGTVKYMMIKNRDTTTTSLVYLLTTTSATTGAAVAQFAAGEVGLIPLSLGMQTPTLIASGSPAIVEVLILQA